MSDVDLTIEGQTTGHTPGEPGGLRLVFTLGLAGMISGLALAGAYELTRPTIESNQIAARRRAVFDVVPGAKRMQKLEYRDGELVPVEEGKGGGAPEVYAAYDDGGGFLGYAIDGEGPGYQDTIQLLFGYDPARQRIIGMYVLESRETPGLGDKIMRDPKFGANFDDLAVDPEIEVVKGGKTADNEVDAITGATISSRSVVKILNGAIAAWRPRLPAPGHEPALAPGAEPAGAGPGGAENPTGTEGGG